MDLSKDRNQKIINALETYFSDASLQWDKVMQSKILADPRGMVSFEDLSKLPKLRNLQVTVAEIRALTKEHSLSRLQLSENDERVGRIKPFVMNKKEELDEWSIYVEGLSKPYNTEQSIRELFNSLVGHVSFFRIPPNQKGQTKFFGYCFIEFDNKDYVSKAVNIVNRYPCGNKPTEGDTSNIDKLNLRVMSKLDWIKLKNEYIALLDQRRALTKQMWEEYNNQKMEIVEDEKPYTEGLIVHVDQLHPKCPKTAAISLLETSGVKIAFMNTKKKGLSSTHIRLKDPKDAIAICQYFDTHPTVQETEKDIVGKQQETKTFDCLKLRVLTGSEERIYWENDARTI